MLFGKRLLTISENLIFEIIQSERIAHEKFGLGLVGPLRLESYGEISNAILLNGEGRGIA